MVVPPRRPGRTNEPACIGRPDNATSEVASEPVAIHPMRWCLKYSGPGNTTSNFIQFGASERARLSGGRRRKTLVAHVTTERKRVVTWAPALYSYKSSDTLATSNLRCGSTGSTPSSSDRCGYSGSNRFQCPCSVFFDRVLTINASGVQEKPPLTRVEFFVTPVFRVRIVDPLDAATAEKWQGIPHLAFAKGVGRVR